VLLGVKLSFESVVGGIRIEAFKKGVISGVSQRSSVLPCDKRHFGSEEKLVDCINFTCERLK
jgi:hypothetical protein